MKKKSDNEPVYLKPKRKRYRCRGCGRILKPVMEKGKKSFYTFTCICMPGLFISIG